MRWFLTSAAAVIVIMAGSEVSHAQVFVPRRVVRPVVVPVGPAYVRPVVVAPTVTTVGVSSGYIANYSLTYGVRASYGYYYPGIYHSHWSSRTWLSRYGCYGYYCPSTSVYYYWCVPDNCYYPVNYCPYGVYTF